MCESKEKEKQYLNAICVIANAMYTNMNQLPTSDCASNHDVSATASTISNPNQPFNPSNIGRVLKDLLK